jgi:hypothetical protein
MARLSESWYSGHNNNHQQVPTPFAATLASLLNHPHHHHTPCGPKVPCVSTKHSGARAWCTRATPPAASCCLIPSPSPTAYHCCCLCQPVTTKYSATRYCCCVAMQLLAKEVYIHRCSAPWTDFGIAGFSVVGGCPATVHRFRPCVQVQYIFVGRCFCTSFSGSSYCRSFVFVCFQLPGFPAVWVLCGLNTDVDVFLPNTHQPRASKL